jgi:hypothetical protein
MSPEAYMADPKTPNPASEKIKAEGERWKSDPDTIENADRDENPEALYDSEDVDDAGGITNRPLTEEIENQGALPPRGEQRQEKTHGR